MGQILIKSLCSMYISRLSYQLSLTIFFLSPKLHAIEKVWKKCDGHGLAPSFLSLLPERIYNSHYGNGVPAMFTS